MFNEVNELLNENKIKMMTKMAIYEKNEGKSMLKTAKYFKGDYIAFGVLKTVIATTFAGVILLAMYFLCNAEGMIRDINNLDYIGLAKKFALYYVLMLIVFCVIAGFVYYFRYENTRKGIKRYFSRLNKLGSCALFSTRTVVKIEDAASRPFFSFSAMEYSRSKFTTAFSSVSSSFIVLRKASYAWASSISPDNKP